MLEEWATLAPPPLPHPPTHKHVHMHECTHTHILTIITSRNYHFCIGAWLSKSASKVTMQKNINTTQREIMPRLGGGLSRGSWRRRWHTGRTRHNTNTTTMTAIRGLTRSTANHTTLAATCCSRYWFQLLGFITLKNKRVFIVFSL